MLFIMLLFNSLGVNGPGGGDALTPGSPDWYNSLFGGPIIYAIVESGGKQYRVTPGQVIEVDLLDAIDGTTVELDRVLFVGDGDKVTSGRPIVEGAKVVATSQGEVRGDKTTSYKYKNKTRYHRKVGHHQSYTRLAINSIVTPGAAEAEPAKRVRRTKKEVTQDGA
jgi:large subunit ribosomal protein L21